MSGKQEKEKKLPNENSVEMQETMQSQPEKRVCVYRRVRTKSNEGYKSLITRQTEYYKKMLSLRENWQFVGMYADAVQARVELQETDGFKKMMKDCEAGKIDLIITKSFTQFLESAEDSTEVIDRLRELEIEVFSEKENSNTQPVESERESRQ